MHMYTMHSSIKRFVFRIFIQLYYSTHLNDMIGLQMYDSYIHAIPIPIPSSH